MAEKLCFETNKVFGSFIIKETCYIVNYNDLNRFLDKKRHIGVVVSSRYHVV